MSVGKPLACAAALISISHSKKVRKITTFFPFLQMFLRFFVFFCSLSCIFDKKSVPLQAFWLPCKVIVRQSTLETAHSHNLYVFLLSSLQPLFYSCRRMAVSSLSRALLHQWSGAKHFQPRQYHPHYRAGAYAGSGRGRCAGRHPGCCSSMRHVCETRFRGFYRQEILCKRLDCCH